MNTGLATSALNIKKISLGASPDNEKTKMVWMSTSFLKWFNTFRGDPNSHSFLRYVIMIVSILPLELDEN